MRGRDEHERGITVRIVEHEAAAELAAARMAGNDPAFRAERAHRLSSTSCQFLRFRRRQSPSWQEDDRRRVAAGGDGPGERRIGNRIDGRTREEEKTRRCAANRCRLEEHVVGPDGDSNRRVSSQRQPRLCRGTRLDVHVDEKARQQHRAASGDTRDESPGSRHGGDSIVRGFTPEDTG